MSARDDYPILVAWARGMTLEGFNGDFAEVAVLLALDEIDRLRAELTVANNRLGNAVGALIDAGTYCTGVDNVTAGIDRLRSELAAERTVRRQLAKERTVRKQLAASRDAMVATVSFLASVIRCGEPMTPEVKQAIKNYYTRWDTLLAASNALDKDGE